MASQVAVIVDNLPTVVDAGPDQMVFEDVVFSLALATFTDAGIADTHAATIDWGNGTVEPGTVVETGKCRLRDGGICPAQQGPTICLWLARILPGRYARLSYR